MRRCWARSRAASRRRSPSPIFEWASSAYQCLVVDWTIISDGASADAFIKKFAAVPISTERWTSISGAIDFAMKRLAASPYASGRRVVDSSGDGRNKQRPGPGGVHAGALSQGIVINGLPIVNDRPTRWGTPPERDLDLYYRDQVMGRPGSFYIVAAASSPSPTRSAPSSCARSRPGPDDRWQRSSGRACARVPRHSAAARRPH